MKASTRSTLTALLAAALALLAAFLTCGDGVPGQDGTPDLGGAWSVERYRLADGTEPPVTGRIFFTDRDWTVLFFVTGPDGSPLRGSGEGGTYTLRGSELVFTHLYDLSGGADPEAAPVRMVSRPGADGPEERCTIVLTGDELTIRFPSGNAMDFRRRGGP